MKEHIFEPCICFENKINCIKDLLLDHHFTYNHSPEGVNIVGNICLSFVYEDEFENKPASINQPVELFISLNEIDSLKEITLEIEDFTYEIKENEVKFKILTKLKGNKEDFVFFELSPSSKINKEAISLLMRNSSKTDNKINISNESLKKFEEIIKSSALDLIASSSEDITCTDDIIEFCSIDNETNNINDIEIIADENLLTENKIENSINEEPIINIEEEKDTNPIKIIEDTTEVKIDRNNQKVSKKEELFKETYVSNYFFYVLKEDDTKEKILNKFNIKEEDFNKFNKEITYKKGILVRIPK